MLMYCVYSCRLILHLTTRCVKAHLEIFKKPKVTRLCFTNFSHGYSDVGCGKVHRLPLLAADLPCFLCGSIKALMAWQAGLTDSTGAGVLWG